jgi:uncharacterized coiled-coil protein SlyX
MPELIAFAILALLGVAALVVAISALRAQRALHARLEELELRLDQSSQYYQGLSASAVGQGELLSRVNRDLARLRERLEQMAATTEEGGAAFNQAIRMARKGSGADEIMETCGLSRVEADLVVLLHHGQDPHGQDPKAY